MPGPVRQQPPNHPEGFKGTINVPIAIPAWGLLSLIATAVFTAGVIYTQLNSLIESNKKNDERITLIAERQTRGLAAIGYLEQQVSGFERRISTLERAAIERSK